MNLVYHLTDAARKKIFVETGRDPGRAQSLEVDPAQLSAAERVLLAEWNPAFDRQFVLQYSDVSHLKGHSTTAYLQRDSIESDPAALIAAYRDARAAGLARLDAQDAERIAEEIARFLSWDSEIMPSIVNTSAYQRSPRRQEWLDAHAVATAAAKARQAALDEQRRRDEDARAAEKAARLAERAAWATAHGSDRLKKCIAGGYDCQRLYVAERAATEIPGYAVDFDDKAAWKARSGPSEAALDEAARVGGEVVWLTFDAEGEPTAFDMDDSDGVEAVVVRGYLGKYDLIKIV